MAHSRHFDAAFSDLSPPTFRLRLSRLQVRPPNPNPNLGLGLPPPFPALTPVSPLFPAARARPIRDQMPGDPPRLGLQHPCHEGARLSPSSAASSIRPGRCRCQTPPLGPRAGSRSPAGGSSSAATSAGIGACQCKNCQSRSPLPLPLPSLLFSDAPRVRICLDSLPLPFSAPWESLVID